MVEVQITMVDAISAPVTLAQQWGKIGKHCWDRQECIEVEHYWPTMKLVSMVTSPTMLSNVRD
jgi:hypothetical protein